MPIQPRLIFSFLSFFVFISFSFGNGPLFGGISRGEEVVLFQILFYCLLAGFRGFALVNIVYTGQALVGYVLGWSSSESLKLQDPDKTPLPDVISDDLVSFIGALIYIGAIFGPYLTTYLSNTKGRKLCFKLSGAIAILAMVTLALSRNFQLLMTSRIIAGISMGIMYVLCFVYIGEISSPNIRGFFLSGVGLSSTLGTLLVYSVGPYVSFGVVAYIGIAISIFYTGLTFTIPETPMFYFLKGDYEKANQTLIELGREDELDDISQKKAEITKTSIQNWKEIVTIKSNRKTVFITLTLNILQQMSGIIAVVFYATTIFKISGSNIDSEISTIIIGVAQVLASIVSAVLVDGTGRKKLLMYSNAFCVLSLGSLGTYFYFYENEYDVTSVSWLPLVTLIIYFLAYSLGLAVIPQTLVGEMFTPNVRSLGSTVTITASFVVGFVVAAMFSSMISGIGASGTFWLFASACVVGLIFTAVFVPETKQKTLDEIIAILS